MGPANVTMDLAKVLACDSAVSSLPKRDLSVEFEAIRLTLLST